MAVWAYVNNIADMVVLPVYLQVAATKYKQNASLGALTGRQVRYLLPVAGKDHISGLNQIAHMASSPPKLHVPDDDNGNVAPATDMSGTSLLSSILPNHT